MLFGTYAFSEVALSSDSVNQQVDISGIEASTSVGDVSLSISGNAAPNGIEAVTSVGQVILRISSKAIVTGVSATAELGQVQTYGLVVPGVNVTYTPVGTEPNSPYENLAPQPANTWNDLVI